MRKLFLLLLVLIQSFSLYSQSKEETQNWILKELSNHRLSGNIIYSNYFIMEGYIIEEHYWNVTGKFTFRRSSKIPLKNIYQIQLDKSQVGYIFNLKCKSDCVANKEFDNDGKIENEYLSQVFEIQIDQGDSTLLNRIPKALLHLIKLHGGNAKLVPIKKDPF